jgi:hypothetical protein
VAVLATVLAAARPVPPDLGGYHLAFLVAAVAMLGGAVIASRVRDADAAATMAAPADPAPAAASALPVTTDRRHHRPSASPTAGIDRPALTAGRTDRPAS